jgi:hypothetical protein
MERIAGSLKLKLAIETVGDDADLLDDIRKVIKR